MKVKDILIKDVVCLKPDTSAKEALSILTKRQISGLPVVDEQGKLVGMFTEKEVLCYVLPCYIEKVGRFIYQADPKATKKKFAELERVPVSKLMRKDMVTITGEAGLVEAARVMLTQKARRLPVLDDAGKMIGIIARNDVLNALTRASESETP